MSENLDILVAPPRAGEPISAGPGSEPKIRAMIERALRREPLFHPHDGLRTSFRPALPNATATAGRVESA